MTGTGHRPYVPADAARGLRPGTHLATAPVHSSARRGLRVPEAYRRRARPLRLVAAADLASVLVGMVAAATTERLAPYGKACFVGAFAGVGVVGLALACLSLDRVPLRLRATSGWILGVPLLASCASLAAPAPGLAAAFGFAAFVQGLGAIVVHATVRAADAEASHSRTAGVAPAAAPPPPAVRGLRAAVLAGGIAWALGGLVEATRGNWWLGLLATGLGALAIRSAPDVGRTRTDARVPAADRGNPLAWALVPLGAVGMLLRAAWLLGWI